MLAIGILWTVRLSFEDILVKNLFL